ncbi:MarR family transcriptional regulator [Psychromonas sp. RZ22]|nr:MarR family transcriptional regulator [Psychromonas sp. RZ22]TEW55775.1 MarR family transcriptional regulator [Psychromonas sp. RZ22]
MDRVDVVIQQWKIEKPLLDTEPMALIGRLLRVNKHLETSMAKCHQKFGLTLGEFDVLATLKRSANHDGLTPSELLEALLLTSGAMTNRLAKLESKKLIVRVQSEHDKRSVFVALTAQGHALIDRIIEEHVQLQQTLVASLTQTEKQVLNNSLKTWLADFEQAD